MSAAARRGASEGNRFYAKLWELSEKLEEVAGAFTAEDLGDESLDREFAQLLGSLEQSFNKVIQKVREERGLPDVVPMYSNEDVKWVLGVTGAKEPQEVRRLR